MSVIQKIAYNRGIRNEAPNQELARELALADDMDGITEIARNLWNKNANIQSDCLKVLYEIGFIKPGLVAGYVVDFLQLLLSKNNRLVWGGMIALSTIAKLQADVLFERRAEILNAMANGSVITKDAGVKTLADVAAQDERYHAEIFPQLLKYLQTCRPADASRHAEVMVIAVNAATLSDFIQILEHRVHEMSSAQAARARHVIKKVQRGYKS